MAVTMYVLRGAVSSGTPDKRPVLALRDRPIGRAGETVKKSATPEKSGGIFVIGWFLRRDVRWWCR